MQARHFCFLSSVWLLILFYAAVLSYKKEKKKKKKHYDSKKSGLDRNSCFTFFRHKSDKQMYFFFKQ